MLCTKYWYRPGIGHFLSKSISIGSAGENWYRCITTIVRRPQLTVSSTSQYDATNQYAFNSMYAYVVFSQIGQFVLFFVYVCFIGNPLCIATFFVIHIIIYMHSMLHRYRYDEYSLHAYNNTMHRY